MAETPQPPSDDELAESLLELQADAYQSGEKRVIQYANDALLPIAQQQEGEGETPPTAAPTADQSSPTVLDLERQLAQALDEQKKIFQQAPSPEQVEALRQATERVASIQVAMESARQE